MRPAAVHREVNPLMLANRQCVELERERWMLTPDPQY
jgi:hypothetical protein